MCIKRQEYGPDIVLSHAAFRDFGACKVLHDGHSAFTGMDGAAHGAQLVLCLDAARAFGDFLAITIIEARTADRV